MAFSHHHHRPLASLNLVFRPPSLHPANSSLRLRYYTKSRSPSLPLSERSANLLVGTTIATCVGISAYSAWAFLKPQTNPNPEPGLHRPRRHGQPQESLLSRITNPTPEFVRQNLILTRTNIVEGRYWTLLTSTLTHLTPLHLLFNMSTLWSFGLPLARLYGARAYLGVWIGSGLVGSLAGLASEGKDMRASAGVEEGGKVVVTERGYLGASGSIMGMLSVMTCFAPRAKIGFMFVPIDIPAWAFMIVFSAASVYAQTEGHLPWIGHMAHVGGAAFGALYYLLALRGRYRPARVGMR